MKNKSNFIKYVEELAEDAKNLTEKYGKCETCTMDGKCQCEDCKSENEFMQSWGARH